MKIKYGLVLSLPLFCGVSAVSADVVAVTNKIASVTYSTNTVLEAGSIKSISLPDVGTPMFWFDCSDRTGWTVDPETKVVTYIPSRTGDGRSLATAFTTPGNWSGWDNGTVPPKGPVLVENVEALQGGATLDFGPQGSGRGLIFSPLASTATSEYPYGSNVIVNIGTVVAIYDSTEGGGFLLGGGYGINTIGMNADGIHFIRGTTHSMSSEQNIFSYREPTLRVVNNNKYSYYNPTQAISGVVWQNGIPTTPHFTGFSGGWEILSFEPRSLDGCPVLLPQATGIGINDTRNSSAYVKSSGGMRIAEMVIYGKVLSQKERKAVEAYLVKKWFGKSIRGYNGNANIANMRVWHSGWYTTAYDPAPGITVNAADGENLTINRLRGGRGSSGEGLGSATLVKTGPGTLTVGDASESGLDIKLREGTLAFERRAVPTNLPWGVLFRIDASQADTLSFTEADGKKYVDRWEGVEQLPWCGYETRLCSTSIVDVASRPWYVPDVFGPGMGVVDFGEYGSGRRFRIVRKNAAEPVVKYKGVTTVIAVIGVQKGGGNLMEDDGAYRMGYFWRGSGTSIAYDTRILQDGNAHVATHPSLLGSEGVVFLNGVQQDASEGYSDPGYHLVAMQTPGSQISVVGGWRSELSGGMRIAELVMYDRVLTEREFMDAQAYLNAKWFKRRTPGYAAPEGTSTAGESRSVTLGKNVTIDVSGEGAVQLDALESSTYSRLTKTGDGVLLAPRVFLGEVNLKGGSVQVVSDGITNAAQMAASPAFHLDVTAVNTFDTVTENGTNFVYRWYDRSFRNMAWRDTEGTAGLPWLTSSADDLDGLSVTDTAVIDFGVTNGCKMDFGHPIDAIRSVFVVWRPGHQTSSLLGSTGTTEHKSILDYARGLSNGALFSYHNSLLPTYTGVVMEDGVLINSPEYTAPSEGWHLIEVHPRTPNHASALCTDRGYTENPATGSFAIGGSRYAEIIIYTRELSERERTATRNYLRSKWFGAEAEELPAADDDVSRVRTIVVSGTNSLDLAGRFEVERFAGEGIFLKSGEGTLEVGDVTSLTGKVFVTEGSLSLKLPPPGSDGVLVSEGLILHLDANKGITSVLDEEAEVSRVTRWDCATGSGWYAVPGTNGSKANPVLAERSRAGLSVVNLATNDHQYMVFMNPQGEQAAVTNIRSVVWVMDTEEGGGMLLGGGRNYVYGNPNQRWNFHRGTQNVAGAFQVDCSLLSANGQANLRDDAATVWRVNGSVVNPDSDRGVLSGGWDMITMAMTSNDESATEAEGLACDGRTISEGTFTDRSGGQRIGEILIYSNALTSAQMEGLEAYLKKKWGFVRPAVTNLAEVYVAEGASIDLSGSTQYLAAVSGGGVVSNGMLTAGAVDSSEGLAVEGDFEIADGAVWSVTFGADGCETLSVDGTLAFGAGIKIELGGLDGRKDVIDKTYTLATADVLSGTDNLASAKVIAPGLPSYIKPSVRVSGNSVTVRFSALGMLIQLR